MEKEKLDRIKELEKMLTPKERQFIEELEFDGNKGEAALRAGLGKGKNIRSAGTAASRILAKEKVRELRALRAERAYEELGLSRDTIIAEVVKVYRRCMLTEPVLKWDPTEKKWIESGEYRFDSKGALKALELMGEPIGVFKNDDSGKDQSIDVNINVVDKIEK